MKDILRRLFTAVIGFTGGVIFMIYRCGYILEGKQKKLNKYFTYYKFLDSWLSWKENNNNYAEYFNENSVLFYTDRYENMAAYEVIAVVKYNVDDVGEWDFRVRNHGNRKECLAWMAQLKEMAFLYREPEGFPERLITLATCDRRVYGKDGRFLIIGGK